VSVRADLQKIRRELLADADNHCPAEHSQLKVIELISHEGEPEPPEPPAEICPLCNQPWDRFIVRLTVVSARERPTEN